MKMVDLEKEIRLAEQRIRPHIRRTPVIQSDVLSSQTGGMVWLKAENRQYTGSFKARGALNKVMSLDEEQRAHGVITASTGNHGMGVARALQLTGTHGTIYLPRNAQPSKIEKLRAFGAQVEFFNGTSLETELHAKRAARETGAIWISPYNDLQVMGGQGTIGIELEEQVPALDYAFITVGGGGLVSGVAGYLKSVNPKIVIVGCWPENSPEMYRCLQAGRIIEVANTSETLSDGSAGAVEAGSITFDYCRALIDDHVLVPEDEIANAMHLIYAETGDMVEGSAAVAVAACLTRSSELHGKQTAVLLCGGNVDPRLYESAQHRP